MAKGLDAQPTAALTMDGRRGVATTPLRRQDVSAFERAFRFVLR